MMKKTPGRSTGTSDSDSAMGNHSQMDTNSMSSVFIGEYATDTRGTKVLDRSTSNASNYWNVCPWQVVVAAMGLNSTPVMPVLVIKTRQDALKLSDLFTVFAYLSSIFKFMYLFIY